VSAEGTIRVAHFSDTHVLSLRGVGPGRFLNKRWTGAVNLALNRARHYRTEVFAQLLEAVAALDVDHAVCTGDLVNLALEPEFEQVAGMLREVFGPDELTVVPGNHDYYVKEAVNAGLFERTFAEWMPQDVSVGRGGSAEGHEAHYPVVRVRDGVFIVGLSSAQPTPVFMATGKVGTGQLAEMSQAFRAPEAKARFRMLLLHHPLLPDPTRRLEASRRLVDAEAVIEALWACGSRGPQLVVHGHNHAFRRELVPGTPVPVVQVASGSRFGGRHHAEFNVYVVRGGELTGIERHVHDVETGRFVRCDEQGEQLKKGA